MAASEVEHKKKLAAVEEKYVALAGVSNIEEVEKILDNHRQVREKQKLAFELHHEIHDAKQIVKEKQQVVVEKQLKLRSTFEDIYSLKRPHPGYEGALLAGKRTNKPNPHHRNKLREAATTAAAHPPPPPPTRPQSAGNIPPPQQINYFLKQE